MLIVLNIVETRRTHSDANNSDGLNLNSFFPLNYSTLSFCCLAIPRPQKSLGHSSFTDLVKNTAKKFFLKISKFPLTGICPEWSEPVHTDRQVSSVGYLVSSVIFRSRVIGPHFFCILFLNCCYFSQNI